MNNTILIVGIGVVSFTAIVLILLPQILRVLGYHPKYKKVEYDLQGKKALLISTSHDKLGDTGKATGVFASELTIAYYEFIDSGMAVDIASIEGGEIPFEPRSLRYPMTSHADRRFMKDENALNKTRNSLKIDDVDFLEYDIIWMAGGWGAAYDLGYSEVLGEKISKAHAEGILIGSVCHGALGFRMAREIDGKPLVEGKTMTGVSDKQIQELRIETTPLHPETELRKQKANYVSGSGFRDFLATYVAVDGNIVTGQNQNSSGKTAQELLKLLNKKD
ncbi:type 1 glutamine amidotransferase domain-containing protein [bacterium]|nr:type 1 glutamine amidotransferase domain-containing protein [bacterium]